MGQSHFLNPAGHLFRVCAQVCFEGVKCENEDMKSDRGAAVLLMGAAMLGIILANSPFADAIFQVKETEFSFLGVNLDAEHLVSEFLLAIFFFQAGLELKYELRLGALSNIRAAMIPIVAAIAGVLVPAFIYLLINPSGPGTAGWPIPTATDIAFALGMLAIIGRGLPSSARVFLLALAIFDDLIAILIIAFGFTDDLQLPWLAAAVVLVFVLRVIENFTRKNLWMVRVLGFLGAWWLVHQSGVHATIAGVMLGLVIEAKSAHRTANMIQPITNSFILPVFAFSAVSITLPTEFGDGVGVLVGIAVALPLGKILGIVLAAVIMNRLTAEEYRLKLGWLEFSIVAALAGIGFTVSLLLAKLAFYDLPSYQTDAVLGVLLGSLASMAIAAALSKFRSMRNSHNDGASL